MTDLVFYMVVFLVVGTVFLFFHLCLGKLIRPSVPEAEKLTIYECGEPTVGSAWIQFDLRYYVVALLFVVFDVEVAFFFPWAVVFGNVNDIARESDDQARGGLRQQLEVHLPRLPNHDNSPMSQDTAKSWAWLTFTDLLVFFAVLMVGFAYLWRRGDINWIRSTASEKAAARPPNELPARPEPALAVH